MIKNVIIKYIPKINYFFRLLGIYYFLVTLKNKFTISYILSKIRKIPLVKDKVDKEVSKIKKQLKKDLAIPGHKFINSLPDNSQSRYNLNLLHDKYLNYRNFNYNDGKISGAVYFGSNNTDYIKLMSNTFQKFIFTNPLHPDLFPEIKLFEIETLSMVKKLFNGNNDTCGNITSGGTESILLACKTYRDIAKQERGIDKPEIIVSKSVHAAFNKASHYFNFKLVVIPNEKRTGKIDISQVEKNINYNTICLVGSAPNFSYGIIDDIEKLSEIAVKRNIYLHVDCCLGGFILPFLKKEKLLKEKFDFELEGVTSISLDTHKYGYTPKGSSIILYRNSDIRKYQYYINTEWDGGIYATPTMSGSKSGAIIACTWTSLMYHGISGYTKIAKKLDLLRSLYVCESKRIEGLEVIGQPKSTVIAYRSDKFDIYLVSSKMIEKGWNLNILQNPKSFHLCLTNLHLINQAKNDFINDLKESVKYAKNQPNDNSKGTVAIYGMAKNIPDKSIVKEVATAYLDSLTEK